MERGCEREQSSRKMQMLRSADGRGSSFVSLHQILEQQHQPGEILQPQRLFLILNSTARECKSFRTCFVWVCFALFLLFFIYLFLLMGSEMMQIKSQTREQQQRRSSFGLFACKHK